MTVSSTPDTDELKRPDYAQTSKLAGKRILLVVTGGIAAYKSCHLVREIRRSGGEVRVLMTRAATEFVSPLSFATLSGNEPLSDMFPESPPVDPIHLEPSSWADAAVVAPATANIIGKLAHGIADDLCSSVLMAFRKPILIAPAMNPSMWNNPQVQKNVKSLLDSGFNIIGPETGEMGGINEPPGAGRMSEPKDILPAIEALVADRSRWSGVSVLVTSGPTREPLDPVRFLSNRSSGKMGDALARQAFLRGAEVTLVRGESSTGNAPAGPAVVDVDTAGEMAAAVKAEFARCDLLIMAAAVADFTSEKAATGKLKKRDGLPRIPWRKTDDILHWAGKQKKKQVVVGFALETESHLDEAKRKLTAKKTDLIALNDATRPESAFGGDSIQLTLIPREGEIVELPILSKSEAANRLLDAVEPLLNLGDVEAER